MSLALPASLNRQFDLLERRLWRMDALVAGTGGIGSLLLSYSLQFISDRFWDTPEWVRFLFALGGWMGFVFFAWQYGSRWLWARRSVRGLAVIVQKRYRRLGDRLLGIVELADPAARPSSYSPELCHAAIDQVAREASTFDFQNAAVERQPHGYILGFLALGLLVTVVTGSAPDAAWNALARWFQPLANIERYTFVTLSGLPDHLVVAQGEPFDIAVELSPDSHWRPLAARSHFDGQGAAEMPIKEGVATFHFSGQTQERLLWVSVGDVTRSIRIQPAVRPDLRQLTVRLDLPAYLQYPPQVQRLDSGSMDFLPGTSAVFTGEAVRTLASARLEGETPVALAVDGPRFTTAPMVLELERDVTFTWQDTLGLAGSAPMSIHVTPREDEPPQVELRGLEAAIAVLPEETVPIDLDSTDDYGVRRLSLAWQTAAPSLDEPPGPVHEIKLADGQPQARTLAGHYDLCPALLDVQPDTTLLVRGLAIDYYPDRQPASSPIYRIHVLSREAHARLIHDQFEKLIEQLEDLARRQQSILQSGKAVRAQTPQQLAAEQSAGKLSGQSNDQRETASQLKTLAAQVADTLKEALRNPQISPDTLKAWAARAQAMNQLAASAMPAAAQSLDAAKADPSQRARNLDQALAREQSILDAMRQMAEQAATDLETLMAQTLAARLRRAAASERDIAAGIQKMLPDTIGLTAAQLPDDERQSLRTMSASHAAVVREAGRLQEEITSLFERTSLKRYGDVAREMDGLKAADSLITVGKLVDNDVGVQSIDATRYWSDQFERWAKRLGENDQSQEANTKPGGQPNAAQMQALLALMRLRQQQDQLREQTSVIEEQKATSGDYPGRAQEAARQQSGLSAIVQSMSQDPTFPIPPSQLAPVGKAMDDAAGLLSKPETGKPAYAAQTDAINLLDAAINQQARNAGQSALAGMIGMGAGNNAGGMPAGPDVPVPGSRDGAAPDQRTVIQAGGVDNSQLPGEFRDAIESYHRAIERSP